MIAIVGGGLAAAKVVEGYREAGGTDEIVMWSQDPHGPYHRPGLSKRVLRGEAEPDSVLAHPVDWYAENGVDLRLGQTVQSIDEIDAAAIVIATGARPRPFDGAMVLRTMDDSIAIKRAAESAKTAIVVGGGFIGCEVTASLTQLGVQVTQVVREPAVFWTLECPPLSEALHEVYRAHGVDLRLDATEIPTGADMVVAGVGVVPNTEIAKDAGLEVNQGIVVNERFETSRPGVYAAGDVAEFFDPLYGKHRRIEHWSTAAYHGSTLGKILAGEAERYDTVSAFFSEEFGKSFRYFGDASGHDDSALEGDFAGDRAVFRFRRDGGTIAAAATGLEDDEIAELTDEIRTGLAARA